MQIDLYENIYAGHKGESWFEQLLLIIKSENKSFEMKFSSDNLQRTYTYYIGKASIYLVAAVSTIFLQVIKC